MSNTSDPTSADPRYGDSVAIAERAVGHTFTDKTLIARALTHPSALDEVAVDQSYERLEFLGDAVVEVIVAKELFQRFPDMSEGGMTRIKISLVSGTTLSEVARELGLLEAIVFGQSYAKTGGRGINSALENVFEAVVAAIYLDAGFTAAQEFTLRTLGPLIEEDVALAPENPKSSLQELLQARGVTPVYRVASEEGPPHERTFTSEVVIDDKVAGRGVGKSKKEAEVNAASEALAALEENADSESAL